MNSIDTIIYGYLITKKPWSFVGEENKPIKGYSYVLFDVNKNDMVFFSIVDGSDTKQIDEEYLSNLKTQDLQALKVSLTLRTIPNGKSKFKFTGLERVGSF